MQPSAENRKGAKYQPQGQGDARTNALPLNASPSPPFRVCEVYVSVQGEGLLTGSRSLFLRTSGCNLRCWFCDTRFASWEPEGDFLTLEELLERCQQQDLAQVKHAVITGGEPMIHSGLPELTRELQNWGLHITIETAATVDLPVVCDLMSISPKLSSSAPGPEAGSWVATHEQRREQLGIVQRFLSDYDYQLKFVIDQPADVEEVQEYLGRLQGYDPQRVLLMPQGTDQVQLERQATWLQPLADEHGFQYCPRSHIAWYGNRRGT